MHWRPGMPSVSSAGFFFSSRRRHTRLVSDWSFRRVLFRSGPYLNTGASDSDHTAALPAPVLETTLTASQQPVNIGGVTAHAEVLNGEIPGPTFRLTVRSEERRVGKECRAVWSQYHRKKHET